MIYDFFMHFATGLCEYVFSRDTYYGYYGYGRAILISQSLKY